MAEGSGMTFCTSLLLVAVLFIIGEFLSRPLGEAIDKWLAKR